MLTVCTQIAMNLYFSATKAKIGEFLFTKNMFRCINNFIYCFPIRDRLSKELRATVGIQSFLKSELM